MRHSFPAHLWKLALALGLMIVAVIIWGRLTATNPPSPTPTTAPVSQASSPVLPTATRPDSSGSGLLPTSSPTPPPPTRTPTPESVYHTVQAGEYPAIIAQEYGISVDTLLEVNQITDPTRLQIGQTLLIPVTVTPTPARPPPTATPNASPTPTPEPVYYTVQAGDTLTAIAAEYDTSVEAIMLANELADPQTLRVGQTLLIPPEGVRFNTPTTVHEIENGDTLSRLAVMYGSTVDDILAANPGLEPAALRIGQKVIVPITSPPINPQADPRRPQITAPEPISPTLVSVQQQVIEGVNAQREAEGLPPLQPDPDLTRMALAHAQDMVARGYFAHVTPDGVRLADRFTQQGVEATWMGENIQRNTQPRDETAAEAIRWFMNSAPHRANILHQQFNQIGVGVVEEPPGWFTFVLVFAKR